MQAGVSPARQARAQHRHELRTLTYVTIDQANGGIVRNLTHLGIAVQAVAALRPGQQLRLRFELRGPRLRVETRGEVMWATSSGQCGIRFVDTSPQLNRQIDEWIFGSLLESNPLHAGPPESAFAGSGSYKSGFVKKYSALRSVEKEGQGAGQHAGQDTGQDEDENDGLMVSAAPVKVIELLSRPELPELPEPVPIRGDAADTSTQPRAELDWLSQPLSGRSLAWTVNTLVVLAALLLFVLVFLSVTGEPPQWPFALAAGATIVVAALYWGFFKLFAGGSPGARLARLRELGAGDDEEDADARFR
jgi:hypothetical protein